MECRKVHSNALDFTRGLLPETLQLEIEEHLGTCSGCRHFVSRVQAFEKMIDAEKALEAGPFFYTRLAQRMKSRQEGSSRILKPVMSWALTGLMVVFMLVSLSAGYLAGRMADEKQITERLKTRQDNSLGTEYFLNDSSQFELENLLISDLK
jgi:predicted anti-sigma-YlaC factor YlaD